MGLPNEVNSALIGAANQGGYEIDQSLRFDGGAYLSRSLGTTSSSWTVSFWTKTAHNDNNDGYWFNTSQTAIYMDASSGAPSDRRWKIRDNSSGTLKVSTALIRDPSAWYHVVYKCDGSNRRLYINNSLDAGFTYSGSTTLSGSCAIGAYYTGSGAQLEGYIAEFHFVDGSALDPDQFGGYNNNGVWVPKKYSGSYGTNGFYLTFNPGATNGIGHDHSGNGNNFSPTGFTTSGTGTDVLSDTPTNNHCTFNPLDRQGSSLSNANLNATMPGRAAGTMAVTSGKWYWECKYNAGNSYVLGIGVAEVDQYYPSEGFQFGIIYYGADGSKYILGTNSSYSSGYSGGHFGIALDLDSSQNTIEFFINGTSKGSFNIPDGHYWTPLVQGGSGATTGSWDMYIDENTWTYTAPTGFKALCTANLPAPTIKDGSDYFDKVLWTGDGTANRAFTNVLDFQSNFSWVKSRSNAESHVLQDSVRGLTGTNGLQLNSNTTFSEGSNGNGDVGAYTSSGFTLSDGASGSFPRSGVNQSGYTYVGWFWKAGTASGSSNTSGSVTSTVSANPTAGFSIVTWSTSSSSSYTVGHGLGVAPKVVIVKKRDGSTNWFVRHGATHTGNGALFLNSTGSGDSGSTVFNGTNPSSTLIYLNGTSTDLRGNQVAYCFAEIEGFSKLGKYNSNNSSDGPFVHCGFRPSLIIVKSIDGHGGWMMYDTTRMPYNPGGDASTAYPLSADRSNAESSFWNAYQFDILSNGFKLRSSQGDVNYSGDYVYMAWAENPFGGDGVSPATAR
jgi:hypothetical protein